MGRPAERRGQIVGQRAHVGPLAAHDTELNLRVRTGAHGPDLQLVDLHRPCLPFHHHALTGQFVETPALVLEGGDHRRHLEHRADETAGHGFQFLLGEIHRLAVENCSIRIQGVCRNPELGGRQVLLGLFLDESDESGHRPDRDHDDAGSERIEGAGMTHLLDPRGALDAADDIVGRHPPRLVDHEKPTGHLWASSLFRTSSIAFSGSPSKVNPEARRCPPPPSSAARAPTSVAPRERRLTFT